MSALQRFNCDINTWSSLYNTYDLDNGYAWDDEIKS